MRITSLSLQNFRSYKKAAFLFNEQSTLVVGPNTAGKTNLIEAIYFLSTGKSFRGDKDTDAVAFDNELARIIGKSEETKLEIVLTLGFVQNQKTPLKKFLVNGVARRRVDFADNLKSVLFSPSDLEIIIASPSIRRNFLDDILEQVDKSYRAASIQYAKGLRQRNALLFKAREEGVRNTRQFEYWDKLLIDCGTAITKKREELIDYINTAKKDISHFVISYDKSIISKERLVQYGDAEIGAGVTLVGPHRDDFTVSLFDLKKELRNAKLFASRGQQRLIVLQLKVLQLLYMESQLLEKPLLLLDDIFSELDTSHINLVLEKAQDQQVILTTTHKEFIPQKFLKAMSVIELGRNS